MIPTATARTNNIANTISAWSGIMASITNASSPEDAIIMATSAPKLNILWVYRDTVAKPPIQPGIEPRRDAMITWPVLVFLSPLNTIPLDSIFKDSIIIIITTTRPVIRMLFLSMSMKRCISLFYPSGDEKVHYRTKRGVCGQCDN